MDLVPREPDDVCQEPLSQAVLANYAGSELPPAIGKGDRPSLDLDVAGLLETVHHFGHRGSRVADVFRQAGLYDLASLRFEVQDRLQVLLVRRVDAGRCRVAGHTARVLRPGDEGTPRAVRRAGPVTLCRCSSTGHQHNINRCMWKSSTTAIGPPDALRVVADSPGVVLPAPCGSTRRAPTRGLDSGSVDAA